MVRTWLKFIKYRTQLEAGSKKACLSTSLWLLSIVLLSPPLNFQTYINATRNGT